MTAQPAPESTKLIEEINGRLLNGTLDDIFVQKIKNAAKNSMTTFPCESHILLSFVDAYYFKIESLHKHMRIALNIDDTAYVRGNYAASCALANLPYEAVEKSLEALEMDPHNTSISHNIASGFLDIGEIERSITYNNAMTKKLTAGINRSIDFMHKYQLDANYIKIYAKHAWTALVEMSFRKIEVAIDADEEIGYEGIYYDFYINQDANTCAQLTTEVISRIANDIGIENMPDTLNISFNSW